MTPACLSSPPRTRSWSPSPAPPAPAPAQPRAPRSATPTAAPTPPPRALRRLGSALGSASRWPSPPAPRPRGGGAREATALPSPTIAVCATSAATASSSTAATARHHRRPRRHGIDRAHASAGAGRRLGSPAVLALSGRRAGVRPAVPRTGGRRGHRRASRAGVNHLDTRHCSPARSANGCSTARVAVPRRPGHRRPVGVSATSQASGRPGHRHLRGQVRDLPAGRRPRRHPVDGGEIAPRSGPASSGGGPRGHRSTCSNGRRRDRCRDRLRRPSRPGSTSDAVADRSLPWGPRRALRDRGRARETARRLPRSRGVELRSHAAHRKTRDRRTSPGRGAGTSATRDRRPGSATAAPWRAPATEARRLASAVG